MDFQSPDIPGEPFISIHHFSGIWNNILFFFVFFFSIKKIFFIKVRNTGVNVVHIFSDFSLVHDAQVSWHHSQQTAQSSELHVRSKNIKKKKNRENNFPGAIFWQTWNSNGCIYIHTYMYINIPPVYPQYTRPLFFFFAHFSVSLSPRTFFLFQLSRMSVQTGRLLSLNKMNKIHRDIHETLWINLFNLFIVLFYFITLSMLLSLRKKKIKFEERLNDIFYFIYFKVIKLSGKKKFILVFLLSVLVNFADGEKIKFLFQVLRGLSTCFTIRSSRPRFSPSWNRVTKLSH